MLHQSLALGNATTTPKPRRTPGSAVLPTFVVSLDTSPRGTTSSTGCTAVSTARSCRAGEAWLVWPTGRRGASQAVSVARSCRAGGRRLRHHGMPTWQGVVPKPLRCQPELMLQRRRTLPHAWLHNSSPDHWPTKLAPCHPCKSSCVQPHPTWPSRQPNPHKRAQPIQHGPPVNQTTHKRAQPPTWLRSSSSSHCPTSIWPVAQSTAQAPIQIAGGAPLCSLADIRSSAGVDGCCTADMQGQHLLANWCRATAAPELADVTTPRQRQTPGICPAPAGQQHIKQLTECRGCACLAPITRRGPAGRRPRAGRPASLHPSACPG